jgi:hypothetical protein
MENIIDNTVNYNNIFNGGEFVLTQDSNGEFVGGGYKIISSFLQGGQPIMTTHNNNKEQDGGNVSSSFENLAVPAGLFYINTKMLKNNHLSLDEHYNNRKTAPDDMIDKLYALVEFDKKHKRKTKKHNIKKKKTNTRKHK